MGELLTSTEVARLLGVAPSSVKRWTRSGLLACVVTPGRHRRFTREQVEQFAKRHREQLAAPAPALDGLLATILSEQPTVAIQSCILAVRARAGSWHTAAESLAGVLAEVGDRWANDELTVLAEHRASERFARALSACAESIVTANDAPTALLATAEGDDHTLGLNLVELCLREAGWNVLWSGRATPLDEIVRRIDEGGIGLVGLSASASSSDSYALAMQARKLALVCARAGIPLVLGGRGAWPAELEKDGAVHRIESFSTLHEFLVADQD